VNKDRVGAHLSKKVICLINRNDSARILGQDDASWDRMTEEDPVSSRGNTRLPDLSTGREVYACSSDLPG
jgi:hypothetical protein